MLKKLLFLMILFLCSISLAQNKSVIYVYDDEGVSQEALMQTMATFQSYTIKKINAAQVKKAEWIKDAALFIMPGGADLPYAKKLNGEANDMIRHYVANGGSYLGICAGAYYAAKQVEFDKNGSLEVIGERALAFFPGKAIGPMVPYDYQTNKGARAQNILVGNKSIYFYFNGGGYFENAEKIPGVLVLGWYQQKVPAIIYIPYQKGNVILSGVHFEYDGALLNQKDPYLMPLLPLLKKSNHDRTLFIHDVLSRLL